MGEITVKIKWEHEEDALTAEDIAYILHEATTDCEGVVGYNVSQLDNPEGFINKSKIYPLEIKPISKIKALWVSIFGKCKAENWLYLYRGVLYVLSDEMRDYLKNSSR